DRETAVANQIALLEALAAAGTITRDQLAAAQFTPLTFAPVLPDDGRVIAPHFALYVQKELLARFGPEAVLGGLEVTTSLNLAWQAQAECVARAQISRLSGQVGPALPADERAGCLALPFLPPLPPEQAGLDRQANDAAIVALDAETAAIKVMVGNLQFGRDEAGLFNIAADGRRQPGTMLNPITALTALAQGYTPATMTLDVPTDFGDGAGGSSFAPRNENGRFLGPMRLRQALGGGLTVPAVQMMGWVGADKVVRTGHSLGITTLDPAQDNALTLAVGGGAVTPLDMAFTFGVINNMGVMLGQPGRDTAVRPLDPVAILKVTGADGQTLYEYKQPERREIVTPQLAFLLNDMLSDRAARCDGMGCPNVLELPGNRPAAAAAGSATDFRDAWTIGYTPQLVTAVWVGNGDNRAMAGVTGQEGAAPIWQAFMAWAMQEKPVAVWTQPPRLVERSVCDVSGFLATAVCPAVSEWFIQGTEPLHTDAMYRELSLNRENGRLATLDTPPELVENRVFIIYPEAAAEWATANGIPQPPDEYDTLTGVGRSSESAAILSPEPLSYVNGRVVITGAAAGPDFASYRLAYFAGLTPTDLRTITNTATSPRTNERLGVWDVSNLDGLVTLLLTVMGADGRFQEVSVPLTVDNTPPTTAIQSPRPNQSYPSGTDSLTIRVTATDNIEVDWVSLYLDGSRRPLATDTAPPFTLSWTEATPGCHTLTAVAVDLAGNQTVSTAVPFCIIE
ncbi:MAG: penicillin-binding protein, partial [Anaerolineae bacterium]